MEESGVAGDAVGLGGIWITRITTKRSIQTVEEEHPGTVRLAVLSSSRSRPSDRRKIKDPRSTSLKFNSSTPSSCFLLSEIPVNSVGMVEE